MTSRLERSALWQLTRARVVSFLREPEVAFWVFAFPVLMALALGIAFRTQGTPRSRVGVEEGPRASALVRDLSRSPDLEVVIVAPADAAAALRRGRIALLVRAPADSAPVLVSDPTGGDVTVFDLPTPEGTPYGIAAGPDPPATNSAL